jgi:membrane-associated protein
VIGGVLWGAGVTALGYYLGQIPFVRDTLEPLIEPILIGIIVLSMAPAAIEIWRRRRQRGMTAEILIEEPIDETGHVDQHAHD